MLRRPGGQEGFHRQPIGPGGGLWDSAVPTPQNAKTSSRATWSGVNRLEGRGWISPPVLISPVHVSSPLERLRQPCHSLITHCSIRILSTRLGTKWEPHKSSSAWMLWIEFEAWHTFSAPHRPTEFWLRGKGSIYSSWVGYHLLPFHWLQSLQPKFSSLLSCLGDLRSHRPSTVPPIQAGGPPYKDLGQGPQKKASTIWENGLQGARD